jgi:hypothetical protein
MPRILNTRIARGEVDVQSETLTRNPGKGARDYVYYVAPITDHENTMKDNLGNSIEQHPRTRFQKASP